MCSEPVTLSIYWLVTLGESSNMKINFWLSVKSGPVLHVSQKRQIQAHLLRKSADICGAEWFVHRTSLENATSATSAVFTQLTLPEVVAVPPHFCFGKRPLVRCLLLSVSHPEQLVAQTFSGQRLWVRSDWIAPVCDAEPQSCSCCCSVIPCKHANRISYHGDVRH